MTTELSTPAQLLEEAGRLWALGRKEYCAAALRVGRLLNDYMIASMRAAQNMNEAERIAAHIVRSRFVEDAATALRTNERVIVDLIHTAAAAALLDGGMGVGNLSRAAVRAFKTTVRRIPCGRHEWRGRGEPPPDAVTVWDHERYEIKPTCLPWAAALFARAVAEDWDSDRCAAEVADAQHKRLPKRRRAADAFASGTRLRDDRFPIKTAAPGDVADYLVALLDGSVDPVGAAKLLVARLEATGYGRRRAV